MSADNNDGINKLIEWQEHQYNPYYWVNRFSPNFPPKRSRGFWILALIDLILIFPAFLFVAYLYIFVESQPYYLFPLALLGLLSLVVILRAYRLKPQDQKISQEEQEKRNAEKRDERKKERNRKLNRRHKGEPD